MSDARRCAELAAAYAELLPARTVLSMLSYGGIDITGPKGEPGTHGENGQSMRGFNFLGWFGWGGSNPTTPATAATADATSGDPA
jgi:hypothetical protein